MNNIRTNEPIQNALVKIAKTDRQVFTDSLGNFRIDVPKGKIHLLVSHPNFLLDDRYLKAPYWKKPLEIGLIDSIWELNDESKLKTLTSEYEFNKCYRKKGESSHVNEEYSVLFVFTKNGDTIEFNKSKPGRIIDTGVFGIPQMRMPFGEIDSTVFNKKSMESIWKSGVKYQFISQDARGYLCFLSEEINIPISEVKFLKVSFRDNKKGVGVTMIVVGSAVAVGGIIVISYAIAHMFDDLHW